MERGHGLSAMSTDFGSADFCIVRCVVFIQVLKLREYNISRFNVIGLTVIKPHLVMRHYLSGPATCRLHSWLLDPLSIGRIGRAWFDYP